MASVESIMAPRTDSSASRLWGGTRSGRRRRTSSALVANDPPLPDTQRRDADPRCGSLPSHGENPCGFHHPRYARKLCCHTHLHLPRDLWKTPWRHVYRRVMTTLSFERDGGGYSAGSTSTGTTGSTSANRCTLTSWTPMLRMGSSRWTSWRSTFTPVCRSISSASSEAVTLPNSRPSSPTRALTLIGLAVSRSATSWASLCSSETRVAWARLRLSTCLTPPLDALTARPRGIR